MLSPCPAALHLLALTNKRKAVGEYQRESGIHGNLLRFGQPVRKTFAGTAISIGGGSELR